MILRALVLVLLAAVGGGALAGSSLLLSRLYPAPKVSPVEKAAPPPVRAAPDPEMHPARQALEARSIFDPTNPDLPRLQRIDDATSNIRRDPIGFPDWMNALKSGAINPRAGLGDAERMQLLDLDIVMRNTREMPHVRFPHLAHTMWLDCANCHPKPFLAKAGANPVSMSQIFRGEYCGMCHDRVAFITFFSCERCHNVAQETKHP